MFLVNIHGLFFLKIKKGITSSNVFQKILDVSNPKPKKYVVTQVNKIMFPRKGYRNVFNTL